MKSSAVYGPAIVLSKLYANSMMVFLNDRMPSGHGREDRVTGAISSIRFATIPEPADALQEQLALGGTMVPGVVCLDKRRSLQIIIAVPHEEGN